MKIYLAGGQGQLKSAIDSSNYTYDLYSGTKILQSFAYADNFTEKIVIPKCSEFLLDSGAFTFRMAAKKAKEINWNEYVGRYANFITRNHIKLFFELDIDSLVGYDEVKKLRKSLEEQTKLQSIPVWHFERGKEEFLNLCSEYDYVAIGGIAGRNAVKIDEKYFPWFINEAHKRNCRIHALGYTKISGLKKYKFDSVDSSSWVAGNRYGMIYKFTGSEIIQIKRPEGMKVSTIPAALNNFIEWKKFSKWAEMFL